MEVLSFTFQAIGKVATAVQSAKANKRKANRLMDRINLVTEQLHRLESNPKLLTGATMVVVEKILEFVEEEVLPCVQRYCSMRYFQKLLHVDSSQAAFGDLNAQLSEFVSHIVLSLENDRAEGHEEVMKGIKQLSTDLNAKLVEQDRTDHQMDIKSAEEHFAQIEGNIGEIKSMLADSFEEQQAQLVSMRRRLNDIHGSDAESGQAHLEAVIRRAIEEVASSQSDSGDTGAGSSIQWTINMSELVLGKEIGRGGFGVVYEGVWQGIDVAVKKLLVTELTSAAHREFQKEMSLMRDLQHPNVVRLFTAVVDPPTLVMVMELCSNGSLFKLIHSSGFSMDWPSKVKLLYEIALGMRFLHGCKPAVLHRDFKSLNVLIGDGMKPKIADFGLSRVKTETRTKTLSEAGGTIAWTAPEILDGSQYTEKADVYSFAITAWEVCSESIPWQGMLDAVIMRLVDKGKRPEFPPDTPPRLQTLLERCLGADPVRRPDFVGISRRLKQIVDQMSPDVPPVVEKQQKPTKVIDHKPSIPTASKAKTIDDGPMPTAAKKTEETASSWREPVSVAVIPPVVKSIDVEEKGNVDQQQVYIDFGAFGQNFTHHINTFFGFSNKNSIKIAKFGDGVQTAIGYVAYVMMLYLAPFYFVVSCFVFSGLYVFLAGLLALLPFLPVFQVIRKLIATLLNPRCDTDVRGYMSYFPPDSMEDATLFDTQRIYGWLVHGMKHQWPALTNSKFYTVLEKIAENSLVIFRNIARIYIIPLTVLGFFVSGVVYSVMTVFDIMLVAAYIVGHVSRQCMRVCVVDSFTLGTTSSMDSDEDGRVHMLNELRWYVKYVIGDDVVPLNVLDFSEMLFNGAVDVLGLILLPVRFASMLIGHIVLPTMDCGFRGLAVLAFSLSGAVGHSLVHPLFKMMGYYGLGYSSRMGFEEKHTEDLNNPWSNTLSKADIDDLPDLSHTSLDYLEVMYVDLYTEYPRITKYMIMGTKHLTKLRVVLIFPSMLFGLMASVATGAMTGALVIFQCLMFVLMSPFLRMMRMLFVQVLNYSQEYDVSVAMYPVLDLRCERRLIIKHMMMMIKASMPGVSLKYFPAVFGYIALYLSALLAIITGIFIYLVGFPMMVMCGLMEAVTAIIIPPAGMVSAMMHSMRAAQCSLGSPASTVVKTMDSPTDDMPRVVLMKDEVGWRELEMLLRFIPDRLIGDDMVTGLELTYKSSYKLMRLLMMLPVSIFTFFALLAGGFMSIFLPFINIFMVLVSIPASLTIVLIGLMTGYEGVARFKTVEYVQNKVVAMEKAVVDDADKSEVSINIASSIMACVDGTTVVVVDGQLYSYGDAPLGNLGATNDDDHAGQVQALRGSRVVYVEGGGSATSKVFYAITDRGLLWVWGSPPGLQSQAQPTVVESLEMVKVAKISHATDHTLVLTTGGSVFMLNNKGLIAVEGLPAAVDIAAGRSFSAVVTTNGDVYTWGKVAYPSVLGHSSRSVSKPRLVSNPYAGKHKILSCGVGNSHLVFLTGDGKILTMGEGRNGELGHGGRKAEGRPRVVESLDRIIQIATASSHTIALSEEGDVYVIGGKLGSTLSGSAMHVPVRLDLPKAAKITDIAADALGGYLMTEFGGIIQVLTSQWTKGLYIYTPPPAEVYGGLKGVHTWSIDERVQWLRAHGVVDAHIEILNRIASSPVALLQVTRKALTDERITSKDAMKIMRLVLILKICDGWRVRSGISIDQIPGIPSSVFENPPLRGALNSDGLSVAMRAVSPGDTQIERSMGKEWIDWVQ